MCGIVGTVQQDRRRLFGVDDVRRMADGITHRGPDDAGFHDGGEAILGMRRLSIIGLDSGHQPIPNEDRSIWVVCNGEIYNFQTLRRTLQNLGHRFSTQSDAEVIVHLYEEYGVDFLDHLEGMFGLALWDERRKRLILARDRLGIKPVYIWNHNSGFAFSSEIKAFLKLPGFSASVNSDALQDYLAIGYAISPNTIFDGVSKLPPASCLVWQDGNSTIERYWEPPKETVSAHSAADWTELVRLELERAVSDHMVSDVPLGAFLSGGIDSSAVATLMANNSSTAINTYSIGYVGGAAAEYYNELPHARTMADRLKSDHREIEVQPDVARLLPKLMWHLEEPISDSATTTTYLVSELAADSVKVILSGVGGDELFAGYNRYLGGHYGRQYERVPAWCRSSIMPLVARMLPSGRQNRLMDIARYTKRFIAASQMGWREQYKFYIALADTDLLQQLGNGKFAQSFDSFDRILESEESNDELLRLLRVDWQSQLSEDLLLLTDKMTMACSIECRVPFLDHKLVELAATIPAEHKLPNGRLKGLLKDSLRGVLPDAIIDRRKRGFGAPVGAWFKNELATLRSHLLDRSVVESRGFLDPQIVDQICLAHDSNRQDYTDVILVLMNLEIWSRLFLDSRTHEDIADELDDIRKAA